MKAFLGVLALAMLCVRAAGSERMTEKELDALVERAVQCEHADFVQMGIDGLKAAGRLSEPELAEAFHRAVMRYRERKEDEARLNCSMYWLVRTLPENQLGKLRELALSDPGSLGRIAVSGYFIRTAERSECLEFLSMVLRRNPAVRGAVWGRCLAYLEEQERQGRKSPFSQDILDFLEKRADDVLGALSCDEMLCRFRVGYATSSQRKERLERMLKNPELKSHPGLVEYFQRERDKQKDLAR